MGFVRGTAGRDVVHRSGDGVVIPAGYNDIPTATARPDTIMAGDGDDILFGDGGGDRVLGEAGNDALFGQGADTLDGGLGDDTFILEDPAFAAVGSFFSGGRGTDTLRTETLETVDLTRVVLSDIERLTDSNSVVLTASQLKSFDVLAGTSNVSQITLSAPARVDLTGTEIDGSVYLNGSAGNDTFILPGGRGTLDELRAYGGDGNDTVIGSEDRDGIRGRFGDDSLIGNGGDDGLSGNDGNDVVDGGSGNDTLGFEGGDDTLLGGAGDDIVYDADGDDILDGGSGDDTLAGDVGADTMIGGSGNDQFSYSVFADLVSGVADTIAGGDGFDELFLGRRGLLFDISDAVITGVEELIIEGRAVVTAEQLGDFDVIGRRGERLSADLITLSEPGTADLTGADISGIDALRGSTGDDAFILTGVSDGQAVLGFGGFDMLTGGLGDDTLYGNGGRDVLRGAAGADRLAGGQGADVFAFDRSAESTPAAADEIADFTSGVDRIDLRLIDANAGATGNQAFAFIGSAAFSGTSGELRYGGGLLSGDVNGDGVADVQVRLVEGPDLAAGDLLL